MKSSLVVGTLAFLLLVGVIPLTPGAEAAFTWSTASVPFSGLTPSSYSRPIGTDAAEFYNLGFALVSTCDSGGSCSGSASFTNMASAGQVSELKGTGAIACEYTGGNVYFAKNFGGLWSAKTLVRASTTNGCGVAMSDLNHGMIFWEDTGPTLGVSVTSDGGATWADGTATGIDANSLDLTYGQAVCFSTTTCVFLYDRGATGSTGAQYDLRICRTTDTGANFNCHGIDSLTAALHEDFTLERVSGNLAVGHYLAGSAHLIKTTDAGASYSTPSIISGTYTTQQARLKAWNETYYGFFSEVESGTCASGTGSLCMEYCETTTGAVDGWSCSNTQTGSGGNGAAASPIYMGGFYGDGKALIFAAWCELNGGSCLGDNRREGFSAPVTTPPAAAGLSSEFETDAFPAGYSLNGFDLDFTGQTVAVRLIKSATDEKIQAYQAVGLGPALGEATENFCDSLPREDGVVALQTMIAWAGCDASGAVNNIHIRNAQGLTVPSFPGCISCLSDIPVEASEDVGAEQSINQIGRYPFSGTNGFNPISVPDCGISGPFCHITLYGWTFDTNTGLLGSAAYTSIVDPTDNTHSDQRDAQVRTASISEPAQLCTGEFSEDVSTNAAGGHGTATYYAGVADFFGTVKLYRVTYTYTTELTSAISGSPLWVNAALSGAGGLSCAGDRAGVYTADNLWVIDTHTGDPLSWDPGGIAVDTSAASNGRGVVLSGDSLHLAYIDADKIKVKWATNGTDECSLDLPDAFGSGLWQLATDQHSQYLWAAKTDKVYGWRLFGTDRCGILAQGTDTGGSGGAGEPATAPFFDTAPLVPTLGDFGARMFGASLFMVGMAASLGSTPTMIEDDRGRHRFKFNVPLAMIGIVMGFVMAWGFHLLHGAEVFAFIALGSIAIGLMGYLRFGR